MERVVRVELYATHSGVVPFERWLQGLRDRTTRAKIRVQIDRLSLGNFGRCRYLKAGLGELRIDWGPGYRVYFGRMGATAVLLLCGGDKSTQAQDIRRAEEYWDDYRRRTHDQST